MRLTGFILVAGLLAACSPPAATTTTEAETTTAASAERTALAVVDTPAANARVTSPLVVTGTAPADWIFEAQFASKLVDANGATLAEAPARAQDDWTNGAATHPFRAELAFTVSADTPATLVLQEDMPEEGATPREVRVPVTLAPR